MFVIPTKIENRTILVMVLQPGSIERIRQHDPMHVAIASLGPPWDATKFDEFIVTFADDADAREILKLLGDDKASDAMQLVLRGARQEPQVPLRLIGELRP